MFRRVENRVWAFDVEWVPDPLAGRLLYDVPDSVTSLEEVMRAMWREGGATEEDPTPFLKTVLCRIISIAAVERRVANDGSVALRLTSLPHEPDDPAQCAESSVVGTFLEALGRHRPQLVGFNSIDSDLKILVQRGVVLGLHAGEFSARPTRPWDGVDYFSRASDWNVDLKELLGGWGKSVPSLHELAVQSGIPGKMDVDGNQVSELWLSGQLASVVRYNEFDALTTYLLWLRVAHFGGHFTSAAYAEEQDRVRELLETETKRPERSHLLRYLEEWERLRRAIGSGRA
jgi:predicted PolB exonuclease-like 3'-5' exonuclease